MCNRVTSKCGRGGVCPVCPWDHGRDVKNRCATGCMRDASGEMIVRTRAPAGAEVGSAPLRTT